MKLLSKTIIGILIGLLIFSNCQAVKLGFENKNKDEINKGAWHWWGYDSYLHELDSKNKHSGKFSYRIEAPANTSNEMYGCYVYSLPAEVKGKRAELTGYIKTKNVKSGYAGLFFRIDGSEETVGFNNFAKTPIKGTTDWKKYKIGGHSYRSVCQECRGIKYFFLAIFDKHFYMSDTKCQMFKF